MAALTELARGAVWIVGLGAALQLVSMALGASPLATALAGAVVADIVGGRAGVRWSPAADREAADSRRVIARHIATGAALGALATALTVGLALAFGWASASAGRPAPSLALGLVRAAALAIRDETLLTGIGFAAAQRAGIHGRFALAFASLAHGAVVALAPGSSPAAVALAMAAGFLFASLWQRGSAWAAVAASTSWSFFSGMSLRGGLLDVTWTGGALVLGPRASGRSAWLAAAVLTALALTALALAARAAQGKPLWPWSSPRDSR
jgi:hypothetical protein